MRLTRVHVRFYKSFNFDYERKFGRTSEPDPWESVEGAWYPYVRIDLDPSVTTIVGANESGKSHLLDAIEKTITGTDVNMGDFCRYSRFFSVERGKRRYPDFGAELEVVDAADVARAKSIGLDLELGDRFSLFRANGSSPVVYLPGEKDPKQITADAETLVSALPHVFRLHPDTPLPDSVPLYRLVDAAGRSQGTRRTRRSVTDLILGKPWSNAQEFVQAAPGWYPVLTEVPVPTPDAAKLEQQYELARSLLFRVAAIDPSTFTDLSDAITDGREGYANGVIQKINDLLARHLNFPRWWAQDREFRLLVSAQRI